MNTINSNINSAAINTITNLTTSGDSILKAQLMSYLAQTGATSAMNQMGVPSDIQQLFQQAFTQTSGFPATPQSLNELMNSMSTQMTPFDQGNLSRSVDDFARDLIKLMQEAGESEEAKESKSGKKSGDDFFIKLATALGKALQQQAEILSDKADALTNMVDQHKKETSSAAGTTDASNSNGGADNKTSAGDQLMLLQTELTAEAQRMNYLATAVNTALSKIGSSISTMGRFS